MPDHIEWFSSKYSALHLKGTEMGKKSHKIGRLVAKLASRFGDDDDDVVRLRRDLAVLEAAKAVHERYILAPTQLPLKVTARKLYLKSVSIDAANRLVSQVHSPYDT